MKKCKKCGADISKSAKHCPKCGARQGLPKWLIVLIVIFVLIAIVGVGSSGSDNGTGGSTSENNKAKDTKIEYTKVTKDQLDDALEDNASVAKETYNDKYLEITGKLGTIDSDLKYISLVSSTEEYDFMGINCTITNEEQKEVIKTLKKDQNIIVKGKITDVGEVLGYYLDITEIIAQ